MRAKAATFLLAVAAVDTQTGWWKATGGTWQGWLRGLGLEESGRGIQSGRLALGRDPLSLISSHSPPCVSLSYTCTRARAHTRTCTHTPRRTHPCTPRHTQAGSGSHLSPPRARTPLHPEHHPPGLGQHLSLTWGSHATPTGHLSGAGGSAGAAVKGCRLIPGSGAPGCRNLQKQRPCKVAGAQAAWEV